MTESRMLVRGTARNRLLVLAVASIALVGVGVLPASAAPVADQTQTIPSSGLSTYAIVWKVGNSFTAGISGTLQELSVPVLSYSAGTTPLADAQAQVWNVDGSGLITGAALASQSIPAGSLAPL